MKKELINKFETLLSIIDKIEIKDNNVFIETNKNIAIINNGSFIHINKGVHIMLSDKIHLNPVIDKKELLKNINNIDIIKS